MMKEAIEKRITEARSRRDVSDALEFLLANISLIPDHEAELCLQSLLRALKPQFIGQLTKKEQDAKLPLCFAKVGVTTGFASVLGLLRSKGPLSQLCVEKSLWLLDELLKTRLKELALYFSAIDSSLKRKELIGSMTKDFAFLPETASNRLRKAFPVEGYLKKIGIGISEALEDAYVRLCKDISVDLEFIAALLSAFSSGGYGKDVLSILIPFFRTKFASQDDYIWPRIAQRIFVTPSETELLHILLLAKEVELGLLLGNSAWKQPMIAHILTTKLLLQRVFEKEARIPNKIAHYLHQEPLDLFDKSFCSMLAVWADPSAMLHSLASQRRYLSQALLAFKAVCEEADAERLSDSATPLLLKGTSAHLDASAAYLRVQGMLVAEELVSMLGSAGEKLDFELDRNDPEVRALLPSEAKEEEVSEWMDIFRAEEKPPPQAVDSDDEEDFQPYETPETPTHKPVVFIRDCLERLIEQKDPAGFEPAFNATEALVRQRAVGLNEVAVELARRLLTLEDRFSTPKFETIQKRSLVATCVMETSSVARCLSGELFRRNYSLNQRILILDVLKEAARELSEGGENRFVAFAGLFFYPLINNATTTPWLDLMGRDHFLLGKLVFTLGALVDCAKHSLIVREMAESLANLVLELRFHPEPFVRQALLYAVSVIGVAVPASVLDGKSEAIVPWLQRLSLEQENDKDVQIMAAGAMQMLSRAL